MCLHRTRPYIRGALGSARNGPEILTLENILTTSSHTSLPELLLLDLSRTLQTRRDSSMFHRAGKWFLSRRVEFSAWETSRFLCILIDSSWQPQPADILDGVQHFIADVDAALGVVLSELILLRELQRHLRFSSTRLREVGSNGSVVRVDARSKEPS